MYPVETNFPTWEKWFRTLTSTAELDRRPFAHPGRLFNW
nr:MAG TPA: hypothetical protein [Caudoviricetes sp.]